MLIVNFQIQVTFDDTHPTGGCSHSRVSKPVLCSQGAAGIKVFVMIGNSGKEFKFSTKVTTDKRYASIPPKAQPLPLLHFTIKDDGTQCPRRGEEFQKCNECILYFSKFIASFSAHFL